LKILLNLNKNMKIINHFRNIFNDQKLLKENPFFALLVFTPASIISSILSIPFVIICLPFLIFNARIQKSVTKFFLYIQHSISLGGLYVIEELVFKDFQYYDIILGGIFAFTSFYKSIKEMVTETLDKTFK
tara:strand:- start:31 stop:423 length:393 start_codon:yes stop_codon:yes gene_type:complete